MKTQQIYFMMMSNDMFAADLLKINIFLLTHYSSEFVDERFSRLQILCGICLILRPPPSPYPSPARHTHLSSLPSPLNDRLTLRQVLRRLNPVV